MEFLKELWTFLKIRKKTWLSPIIIVMLLLGGLLILAQGSVIAPFIYSIAKITYKLFANYRFKKLSHCQMASQKVI